LVYMHTLDCPIDSQVTDQRQVAERNTEEPGRLIDATEDCKSISAGLS
jgi:hypothetical protein